MSEDICYFCGESNPLVLENAHLVPRSIGEKVFLQSYGQVDVDRTIKLCRNCHKKFEMLLHPLVKYAKLNEEESVEAEAATEIIGYISDAIFADQTSQVGLTIRTTGDDMQIENDRIFGFARLPWKDRVIIDKAISLKNRKLLGKFQVKNGFIVDVTATEQLWEKKQVQEEYPFIGTPISLRDQLRAILAKLEEMEKETGIVEADAFYGAWAQDSIVVATRLIAQLRREGVVFEPRKGYLKRT